MTVVHSNRSNSIKNTIHMILLVVACVIIIMFLFLDVLKYSLNTTIPENVSIKTINNQMIEGELKLIHHSPSASYWLYHVNDGEEELIMYLGEMKGNLDIKVTDDDMIEIIREYRDLSSKRKILNLSTSKTVNVSILYKFLNYFK